MSTKYVVLNPLVGGYETVDNTSEIKDKVAELAMALYLAHTHNTPVSTVVTDEDGAETWTAVDLDTL
jgi:hypothetical protein